MTQRTQPWLRNLLPSSSCQNMQSKQHAVESKYKPLKRERFLQANAWAGDGTINIAPDPFKQVQLLGAYSTLGISGTAQYNHWLLTSPFQLYSLHSVNGSGTVIPGVFALLPGKSTEWYNVMWKTVFETVSSIISL